SSPAPTSPPPPPTPPRRRWPTCWPASTWRRWSRASGPARRSRLASCGATPRRRSPGPCACSATPAPTCTPPRWPSPGASSTASRSPGSGRSWPTPGTRAGSASPAAPAACTTASPAAGSAPTASSHVSDLRAY
ncbi:MAG: hypothetical protein AVDCRST_MAG54-907, partial [uncultured Actinomycetospora sp.]